MKMPVLSTSLNELKTTCNTKVEITISLKLTIKWEEKHPWELITHINTKDVPEI